jgi:hypothetical protein
MKWLDGQQGTMTTATATPKAAPGVAVVVPTVGLLILIVKRK